MKQAGEQTDTGKTAQARVFLVKKLNVFALLSILSSRLCPCW